MSRGTLSCGLFGGSVRGYRGDGRADLAGADRGLQLAQRHGHPAGLDTANGVLRTRATKLRASASYTVTFYKGHCGWTVTKLLSLPSVTTTSTGAPSKNLAVSATQVKTIRTRWDAGSGVAVQLARGSSKRRGNLGGYAARGKAVRLENEQTHWVLKPESWTGDGMWDPGEGSSWIATIRGLFVRAGLDLNAYRGLG